MNQRIQLIAGKDSSTAAGVLEQLAMTAGNVTAAGGPGLGGLGRTRDAYIHWVADVEVKLRELSRDPRLHRELQTERYWRIRRLPDDPRPYDLINDEVSEQEAWLRAMAADLRRRAGRREQAPGRPTVLDTNILLHAQLADQISWQEIVGCDQVRLIVPLRVLEELDAKKYSSSQRLAQRARGLLPTIEAWVGVGGAPAEIRSGVTLEVPVEPGPRERLDDADGEILIVCQDIESDYAQPVTLVTGDIDAAARSSTWNGRSILA